jgi:hypothetical protein
MNELAKKWWETLSGVVRAEQKYQFSCRYDFTGNRKDRALSELHTARKAHLEATRALLNAAAYHGAMVTICHDCGESVGACYSVDAVKPRLDDLLPDEEG